jgi:hypothetical protein
MQKDTLRLKSLILPIIILLCLIGGRKYIHEAGTNRFQLLPIYETWLMVSIYEIKFETERVRDLSDSIYSKLEQTKISDSDKINIGTLKREMENFYHRIDDNYRTRLIQDNGGIDEQGYYIDPFVRIKFSEERAYTLYDDIEVLKYQYELGKPSVLVDNEGYKIGISDFKALYCNAPLIILLTNLNRLELRIAKLEYNYLLYITKKYKVKTKNL